MISNFNLSLGIDWPNRTHKEKEIWGLAWIGSLARNIKVSIDLRFGSISTKLGRSWLKGCITYTMYVI